jgi:hypothetical protein
MTTGAIRPAANVRVEITCFAFGGVVSLIQYPPLLSNGAYGRSWFSYAFLLLTTGEIGT